MKIRLAIVPSPKRPILECPGFAKKGLADYHLELLTKCGSWCAYPSGTSEYDWFTQVFEHGSMELWSAYSTEMYARLRDKARQEGWLNKLSFLLYEQDVVERDVMRFAGLEGVLLQSAKGIGGHRKNKHFEALQWARLRQRLVRGGV